MQFGPTRQKTYSFFDFYAVDFNPSINKKQVTQSTLLEITLKLNYYIKSNEKRLYGQGACGGKINEITFCLSTGIEYGRLVIQSGRAFLFRKI